MIYYQSLAMNTTVCCKTLCTNVPLWYLLFQEPKESRYRTNHATLTTPSVNPVMNEQSVEVFSMPVPNHNRPRTRQKV